MYFVVRYNWINNKLTDMSSVGFFRELNDAKYFASFVLPMCPKRNTVVIVFIGEGIKDYSKPNEVYEWNDEHFCYMAVAKDDARRNITITY